LMTKALDYFDPARSFGGDLEAAFRKSKARFFIAAFSSDWRFSPKRSKEIVRALIANRIDVNYAEIESVEGHDSFLMPIPQYHALLRKVFAEIRV
jgi:homoserine O-acetyltransferase/O-succinyltransferase